MTYDQLDALGIDHKWLGPLEEVFAKYDISTPIRQASFIGQCAHESDNFRILEEDLNYSANELMRVWPSRFPNISVASKFEHNPEKIANKVYAGRMGNTEEDDGWKYHGRGVIQLTGKDNYENAGKSIGLNLLEYPDMLIYPKFAALSAGWFWNKKGLNTLADDQNYETMTERINGGLLGLDDRKAKIAKALSVLG
jgi:putative chitinase